MQGFSGIFWAMLTIGGPLVLAAVLAYGGYQSFQRRRRLGLPVGARPATPALPRRFLIVPSTATSGSDAIMRSLVMEAAISRRQRVTGLLDGCFIGQANGHVMFGNMDARLGSGLRRILEPTAASA